MIDKGMDHPLASARKGAKKLAISSFYYLFSILWPVATSRLAWMCDMTARVNTKTPGIRWSHLELPTSRRVMDFPHMTDGFGCRLSATCIFSVVTLAARAGTSLVHTTRGEA